MSPNNIKIPHKQQDCTKQQKIKKIFNKFSFKNKKTKISTHKKKKKKTLIIHICNSFNIS